MSDKKKKGAAEEPKRGLDQKTLERLAAELEADMDALYENRRRRAAERATMTEEEIRNSMVADLEAVLADALESGMDIITIPGDDEEE